MDNPINDRFDALLKRISAPVAANELRDTGHAYRMTNQPSMYAHQCVGCGKIADFPVRYPRVVFGPYSTATSDLVVKLRNAYHSARHQGSGGYDPTADLFEAAADRIEVLETALARLQNK